MYEVQRAIVTTIIVTTIKL